MNLRVLTIAMASVMALSLAACQKKEEAAPAAEVPAADAAAEMPAAPPADAMNAAPAADAMNAAPAEATNAAPAAAEPEKH